MPTVTQLSIILPVLNERDNLAELIPELIEVISPSLDAVEVIVVDDSSTDGTDILLAELCQRDARIRYISRLSQTKSLPQSLTDGVNAATYSHVAWMGADGSMAPASLRDIIDAYNSALDAPRLAVGSRFAVGGGFKGIEVVGETSIWQVIRNLRGSNDSLSAVLLSRILNRYLWLLLDRCCRDLASGFIVAAKSDVLRLGLRGSYGDYCVRFIYLAHHAGLQIIEVPYTCLVRRHGYSKTGTTLWGLMKRGIPYVLLPFHIRRNRPE
jgi:dolichol-phosphate mannosyltransferase